MIPPVPDELDTSPPVWVGNSPDDRDGRNRKQQGVAVPNPGEFLDNLISRRFIAGVFFAAGTGFIATMAFGYLLGKLLIG